MVVETKFLAYFDIIGFKNWVDLDGSKEVFNYMKGYLNLIYNVSLPGAIANADMRVSVKTSKVNYINFSDSIIYYTSDDSDESFEEIIRVCNDFMITLNGLNTKQFSILTKGAIAHGDFYVDLETHSYVGKALIKAYLLEKKIDWLGLFIDDEITKLNCFGTFTALRQNLISKQLMSFSNNSEHGYAFNWADKNYNIGVSTNVEKILKTSIERKKSELKDNPLELSKIIQRINRTLDFIRSCEESG